jgi:hypothetical protein
MAAPILMMPMMAGSRFGLSAEELAEKYGLDEDTSEGIVQEFGETQPFKTSTTTYKRRGNVLGFRRGGAPTTTETVFGGKPLSYDMAMPKAPEAETPEDTRQSLSSIAAQYGLTGLFGHQDYFKALEAGYKPGEIQSYLESNPQKLAESNLPGVAGGLYSEIVAGSVDPSKAYKRLPETATAAGQSPDYFGHEDLYAMRSQGFSDKDILGYLERNPSKLRGQNVPGGGGLYDELTGAARKPMSSSNLSSSISSGGGSPTSAPTFSTAAGASSEYLGHADVEAAKASGASDAQIRDFLQKNIDKLRGTNVPGGGGLYDEYFG